MLPITSDLSSFLQLNQFAMQVTSPPNPALATEGVGNFNPVTAAENTSQNLVNDMAVSSPDLSGAGVPFDIAMNDLASYKDVISAAQDGISQMRTQGQGIKDQAQQGNVSQELIDKMQAEIDSKIVDISIIKDAAEHNGANPFYGETGVTIQNAQELMGYASQEDAMNAMSNMSSSFDLSLNIDGINYEGSAKIAMSMGSDGSFQLAFDVSLNYDLSGLAGDGITSPDASSIIDNFMSMLDGHDSTLGNANKLVDAVFEKIFDNVNSPNGMFGAQNNSAPSSYNIGKQIIQQSSSILDSIMMNQMPGMALNLI